MKLFKKRNANVTASHKYFDKLSTRITRATGSAGAFFSAFTIIIVWLITGPVFHFSDTWQLFINTGTTIITFLMVFVIQQSQNKDTVAIHLKLNELIACNEKASNNLIDVEDLTDQELQLLKKFYIQLSKMAEKNNDLYSTHSLNEAERNQAEKDEVTVKKKTIKTSS